MSKWMCRLIASLSSCIVTTMVLTSSSSAYNLFGEYHLIGNLDESTCFYSGTEFSSTYGITIMRGAIAWELCPTVDIDWTHVTTPTIYTVKVDIGDLPSNVIARTSFYYHHTQYINTEYDPAEHNWDNCTIGLNESHDISYTTMIHEFGHVYGLAHSNDDPTSIMCQLGYGRTATAPSADDFAGIDAIYN